MPTVEQAFQDYLAGLGLSGDRVKAARERRNRFKDFIKKEVRVNGVLWGGSFRRGTCTGPLERAKLHVVLSPIYYYECQKNSRKLLNFLRGSLTGEYGSSAKGRGGQVITVRFPDPPHLDLVPSIKLSGGDLIIPNGLGGWIKSNPHKEEQIFNEKEGASGGVFKGMAKLIKAWNRQIGMPFNPYFLELLVYYRVNDFNKTHAEHLNSLFRGKILFLPEFLSCPAVREPVSLGNLSEVRQKIEDAYNVSGRALNERDDDKAISLWKMLLGEKFGGE